MAAVLIGTQFASASDPLENYFSPITNENYIRHDTHEATKFPKKIVTKSNGVDYHRFTFEYDGFCHLSIVNDDCWFEEEGWHSSSQSAYAWDEDGTVVTYAGQELIRDKYGRVVKTVRPYYSTSNGEPYIFAYNIAEYTYDETGRLLSIIEYNKSAENSEIEFHSKTEYTYESDNNRSVESSVSYGWSYDLSTWILSSRGVQTIIADSEKVTNELVSEAYREGELYSGRVTLSESTILNHGVEYLTKQLVKTYYPKVKDYLVTTDNYAEITVTGENDFIATDVKATTTYNINTGAVNRQTFTKTEGEYRLGCPIEDNWTYALVKSSYYRKSSAEDEWSLSSTTVRQLDDKLSVLKENSVSYSGSNATEYETVNTKDNLGRTVLTETFKGGVDSEKVPSTKTEYLYYLDTDYACESISYDYNDGWQESSSMKWEYEPDVRMTVFQNYLLRTFSGKNVPLYMMPIKYTRSAYGYGEEVAFEYYDRAEIAGVEITADDEILFGEAEYYDLQGRPVNFSNIKSGIYIRRCGSKIDKVAIK